MKLGTHNSMTYLPPKKWWMYPFRFAARCQTKTIEEQYKLGARMFDLRIDYDNTFKPYFRHGSMAFKGDVLAVLAFLNSKGAYVRLLLENKKEDYFKEYQFIHDCVTWVANYPNITFFCGRRKGDWKQLFKFEADDINVAQPVSSMTGTILDDWCPWFYARFNNKKNYKNRDLNQWTLFDFIHYCIK